MSELPGILLATAMTLAIFSRVWRPNAGFRYAQHLLLGALTGYVAAVLLRTVLIPGLAAPVSRGVGGWLMLAISILLIVLLAFRFTGKASFRILGLIPLGLLFGIGGALALAGAVRGTLAPQLLASLPLSFAPTAPVIDALTVALATFTTVGVIVFFQRRTRAGWDASRGWVRRLATLGYWGLMIAFGALLATTAGARLTLLIDRVQYLQAIWGQLFSG